MVKHSPTPWEQDKGLPTILLAADGRQVVDCSGTENTYFNATERPHRERLANAALVRKACSHYDPLVTTLQRLVNAIRKWKLAPTSENAECIEAYMQANTELNSLKGDGQRLSL